MAPNTFNIVVVNLTERPMHVAVVQRSPPAELEFVISDVRIAIALPFDYAEHFDLQHAQNIEVVNVVGNPKLSFMTKQWSGEKTGVRRYWSVKDGVNRLNVVFAPFGAGSGKRPAKPPSGGLLN